MRFSLNERTPGAIKSQGGISGQQVNVEDASAVQAVLDTIHNTKVENHSGNTDWILLGYTGSDVKTLKMLGSGAGGLEELKQQTFPDNGVVYALLRILDTLEGVTTTRFVYITSIGENVSGIMNARVGVNKAAVTSVVGHYSIEVIISNKGELTEENVIGRVQDASGSRSKVLAAGSSNGGGRASHTSSGVSSYVPKAKSAEVSVRDDDGAKAAVKAIRMGSDGTNWVILSYVSNSELGVTAKGSGGIADLKSHLKKDAVAYAFVAVDDKIDATEMKRFVYVRWVPEDVPAMLKGKLTTHRGFVEDWYAPYHLSINASDDAEISEAVIADKLKHMKGSK